MSELLTVWGQNTTFLLLLVSLNNLYENPTLPCPPPPLLLPWLPLTSSAATADHRRHLLTAAAPFSAHCHTTFAVVNTVLSQPLPLFPPATILTCTTTSPRRRLPNGAISVPFHRWMRVPRDKQYLLHPCDGGSRGYNFHTREMKVEVYRNHCHVPPLMILITSRYIE